MAEMPSKPSVLAVPSVTSYFPLSVSHSIALNTHNPLPSASALSCNFRSRNRTINNDLRVFSNDKLKKKKLFNTVKRYNFYTSPFCSETRLLLDEDEDLTVLPEQASASADFRVKTACENL